LTGADRPYNNASAFKAVTIITAVFLPPTLVAIFYGMNFSVMPELTWKHGFTATIIETLLAAL